METRIRTQRFGIRDIFTEGWRVFQPNWLTISLIALCVYAPIGIMSLLAQLDFQMPGLAPIGNCLATMAALLIAHSVDMAIQRQAGQQFYRPNLLIFGPMAFCAGVPLLFIFLQLKLGAWMALFAYGWVSPIATAAIGFVVEKAIQGQDTTWEEAIWHGLSRWPSGIATNIVAGLFLFGLAFLLVIPGVIWAVYYSFSIYAVALRGTWGEAALDYSKNLVQGQWLRVAGIWSVAMGASFGAPLIVGLPFWIVAAMSAVPVFVIVAVALSSVAIGLFTVVTVVWFLNLDYLKSRAGSVMERPRGERPD